jgi:hypothetical protein
VTDEAHCPGSGHNGNRGNVVADAKDTTAGRKDRATGAKWSSLGSGPTTPRL